MSEETKAQGALYYAGVMGWRVFRLAPNGKAPLKKRQGDEHGGFHEATNDIHEVRRMWREDPDANVGIVMGEGVDVIDVDDPALFEKYSQVPGPKVRTPKGLHIYVQSSGLGRRIGFRGRVDYLGGLPGSPRGYVVAPPSVVDGQRYEWLTTRDTQLQPIPDWLYDELNPIKQLAAATPRNDKPYSPQDVHNFAARAAVRGMEMIRAAQEGTRRDTVNKVCYYLSQFMIRDGALRRPEVEPLLLECALSTGLPYLEANATVTTALNEGITYFSIAPPKELAS